ncbi:MAG: ABC transporter substrate-binding protein [Candidatus Fimadaptatus sp.]|jgi:ribose transport system substrate-binding protein
MKKFLAVLLSLMLCCMCLPAFADADAAAEDKPLIGILAPAATHGWVAAVSYNAEAAAKELGLNYKMLTSASIAEMAGQMEELVAQGAKVIVVYPQEQGLETATQMALDAGVAIVNFDMKINVEGTYFLSGDNYSMGVESANYIANALEGAGNVVILDVPTSGSVAADRIAGFTDTIAQIAPDVKVINTYATEFTRDAGLRDMADVLTANPQIDAVLSLDDETSIGAVQAIEDAGRTDIKVITGGGGCQEYFNMMPDRDMLLVSALYSPAMIRQCVQMAADLVEGKEVATPVVIPTTIVDKNNVADYLDANSPY